MPRDKSPPQGNSVEAKPHGKHRWRDKVWSSSEAKAGRATETNENTEDEGSWRDKIRAAADGRFSRKNDNKDTTEEGDRWRDKIRASAEEKLGWKAEARESNDDEVAKFLSAGGKRSQAKSQQAGLTPRIDTNVAARSQNNAQTTPFEIVDQYRRPKPSQNKGLHVDFVATPPEIIGEGGDEAELPALYVSKSRLDVSQTHAESEAVKSSLDKSMLTSDPSRASIEREPALTPVTIQRRPTSHDSSPGGYTDEDNTVYDESDDSVYSPSPQEYRKPLPQMPKLQQDSRNVHHTYDHAMSGFRGVSPTRHDSSHMLHPYNASVKPSYEKRPSFDEPTPETLQNNSVTPRASPQPPHIRQETPTSSEEPSSSLNNSSNHFLQSPPTPPKEAPPTPPKHSFEEPRHLAEELPAGKKPKAISLRTAAKGVADDSLGDFDMRVKRFNELFRLGVSAHSDMMSIPFVEWIRTAAWWFLKGRTGLENAVRTGNTAPEQLLNSFRALEQAHVDLAKAWWIARDVTPGHPEITRFGKAEMKSILSLIRNFGDQELAELVEVHLILVANLRALTMSMKRNNMLPAIDFEAQRLDLHVLLTLPPVPSGLSEDLVNNDFTPPRTDRHFISEPFFPMPVGDSSRHFCFGRMFPEASFELHEDEGNTPRIPCVISVLRERTDWGMKAAIASPDGQLSLVIQPMGRTGLTWREVIWKIADRAVEIRIFQGFDLRLQFSEKDFRTFWGIWDYTRRVQKDFSPRKDETIIFESDLENFQCTDPGNFPSEDLPDCKLRLFEKKAVAGDRRLHSGYRLIVITPPVRKTLSCINYPFGNDQPILFSYSKFKDSHRLVLRIQPSIKLSPSFHHTYDRQNFLSLLCGTHLTHGSQNPSSLPLQRLQITTSSISDGSENTNDPSRNPAFHFSKLRLDIPSIHSTNVSETTSSDLRLMAESPISTLVDRLAPPPNNIHFNLSVLDTSILTLLISPKKSPQTLSLLDSKVSPPELSQVCSTLQAIHTASSTRRYTFSSLSAMHALQHAITGFKILFDGPATSFAISRRRMVVPMVKQWHAEAVRLQVLANEKQNSTQLVAFFQDFSHGKCMNFTLKVTDMYESFEKDKRWHLRFVDAKFALPKPEEDDEKDFVCLDNPEWPSEHDDIVVAFESEQERDKFAEVLPAPVNKMSKMASLRR